MRVRPSETAMDPASWAWIPGCVQLAEPEPSPRLRTDGGDSERDEAADGNDDDATRDEEAGDDAGSDLDRSNVEVSEGGSSDPVDPKWEKPDPEEIPEFEVRADEPMTQGGKTTADPAADADSTDREHERGQESADPTEGMPNTARSPGDSRIKREGTEGYVAALELTARLPDDVRLPEEAADLVPAAVEAELEQDIQSFAAAEFENQSPHVDVLEFVDRDGEVWLRLRLGIPAEAFGDLDPEEIRAHALQELEGFL